MEEVKYSLLRYQTAACHLCSIIVSFLLITTLYGLLTLTAEKPNTDWKIQHKARAQQRGGRRRRQRKQRSTPTQVSGRRFPPKRRAPATPEGSYQEHTLAHSHNRETHTTRVCLHTRTRSFTITRQHCFQKAETGSSTSFQASSEKLHSKKKKNKNKKKMACILEVLFELATALVTCFMIAHLLFTSKF